MKVRLPLLNNRVLILTLAILALVIGHASAQTTGSKRPMTFMDVMSMRSAAGTACANVSTRRLLARAGATQVQTGMDAACGLDMG